MKKLLLVLALVYTCGVNAQDKRAINTKANETIIHKNEQARLGGQNWHGDRYHCYKGDWSSPMPGNCPNHNIATYKDGDPTLVELVSKEAKGNKEFGKNHQNAEDNRYSCPKGDYRGLAPGKCINHTDVDLLSENDPKFAAAMEAGTKANRDFTKNMVNAEDIKFMCYYTDYSDFKAGKCPKHGVELVKSTDPSFAKMVAENAPLKGGKNTNSK